VLKRRKRKMLKPLNHNVILKKEKAENVTASGIVLTSAKEEKNQAIVVAVSNKCDVALKKGMKVIFKEYSTTSFEADDEEYLIISDEDILAITE
jgi:chaperonin GroES